MNQNTENIGFLTVEVRTSNGALGVEDATVYVYPSALEGAQIPNDNVRTDVIYSLRTDSSGKTPTVALETKDKNLSTSYGNRNPFFAYNIKVFANGFYNSEKLNIPVFEGVNSIQSVYLIPLSEYANPNSVTPDTLGRYSDNSL